MLSDFLELARGLVAFFRFRQKWKSPSLVAARARVRTAGRIIVEDFRILRQCVLSFLTRINSHLACRYAILVTHMETPTLEVFVDGAWRPAAQLNIAERALGHEGGATLTYTLQ
jgi:hypothetical protein